MLNVVKNGFLDFFNAPIYNYILIMPNLEFAWDESKAASNKKKHGVSFEEAKTVFYDDFAKMIPDPDHSETEDRFILIGVSIRLRTLVVCHCYREDEGIISIISARKATKHEKKQYGG